MLTSDASTIGQPLSKNLWICPHFQHPHISGRLLLHIVHCSIFVPASSETTESVWVTIKYTELITQNCHPQKLHRARFLAGELTNHKIFLCGNKEWNLWITFRLIGVHWAGDRRVSLSLTDSATMHTSFDPAAYRTKPQEHKNGSTKAPVTINIIHNHIVRHSYIHHSHSKFRQGFIFCDCILHRSASNLPQSSSNSA